MKKISLFIAILLSLGAFAQNVRLDRDAVFNTIIDGNSPFYYERIFPRYLAGDTTLTIEDYFYLYYGYAYQEGYKPLEAIPAQDKMLMALTVVDKPTIEDMEKVVEYGTQVMAADPFSPKNINFLTYGYGRLGDTINERINADRFVKIIAAIESSGTGLTEKSPWHVLWSSHGRDLLIIKGLKISKAYIISKQVEYLALSQKDSAGNKGYYFDYSRMYLKKPENFDTRKRVGGLEINGIKPNKTK